MVRFAVQPASTFGSPSDLAERGAENGAVITGKFAADIVSALDGKETKKEITAALTRVARRFDDTGFAKIVHRETLTALMLGALDAHIEATDDVTVNVDSFSELHARIRVVRFADTEPDFTDHPMGKAIEFFRKKRVVTPEAWKKLDAQARKRAFSVAGMTSEAMLEDVKSELTNRIADGADLRDFKRYARERLTSAGWTPANPSHVETIFRTNVQSAYSGGRYQQMTHPDVLALRPYWQVLTPNDGPPRQRPNHQAAHLRVFAADDPVFPDAWTPWDYNCRCRFRSLSPRQFESGGYTVTPGSWLAAHDLPAPGFTGGGGGPSGDFTVDTPKPEPTPPPEPAAVEAEPGAEPRGGGAAGPFVDIADLEPEPEPSPLEDLRGVASAPGFNQLPPETQDLLAKRLNAAGVGQYKSVPKVELEYHPTDEQWATAHPRAKEADGFYIPSKRSIQMPPLDQRKRKKKPPKIDVAFKVASTGKTPADRLAHDLVHEYGHHVHLSSSKAVDKIVAEAYAEAVPVTGIKGVFAGAQGAPTEYGATNRAEFWSESFAAYHSEHRAWLRETKPVAYDMVKRVLELLR